MPNGEPWPRIVVVTPSYNQGQFLEEAIRSVLLQGYPRLDYVIMDGGSTDGSQRIIEKYDPWLSFWTSEPDGGQCDAINRGFERAKGDLLAWLNSDDTYHPGALASAATAFASRPETGLVFGICDVVDVAGRLVKLKGQEWSLHNLISQEHSCLGQPATFMSARVFETVGPLDVTLHNALDWELWVRFGLESTGMFVPERWATSRLWDQCKSVKHAANAPREHRLVLHRLMGDPSIDEEMRAHIRKSLSHLEWRAGERGLRSREGARAIGHFLESFRLMPGYASTSLLYGSTVAALPGPVKRLGVRIKHTLRF